VFDPVDDLDDDFEFAGNVGEKKANDLPIEFHFRNLDNNRMRNIKIREFFMNNHAVRKENSAPNLPDGESMNGKSCNNDLFSASSMNSSRGEEV
jgi:hypothetical protein